MQEIEIKFLDVDPRALELKIGQIGGKKISDELLEEWVYKKPEWHDVSGRVRIRKSSDKTTIAYKQTTQSTLRGNLEIEFEVGDTQAAKEFIQKIGIPQARHQEKRRIHFEVKGASVDIDFWPKIPPYVEIEAESEDLVFSIATQLGFDINKRVELDAAKIYKRIYGIDMDENPELVFDEK